ncbi:hypothetical protein QUF76_15335 [Desulfobacterales bacterium HSG16]|nr:hypothetical protein [Desulfobacterales bacterium HSG16]
MKKFSFVLMIGVLALWGDIPSCFAQKDDVAMVMNLSGQAIYKTGKKEKQPVEIADFFYQGDRIYLGRGAKIVLIYSAGGTREELVGHGIIKVGKTGSEIEDKTVRVKKADINYLPDKAIIKMGTKYAAMPLRGETETDHKIDSDKMKILSLCDTNIRSLNPKFRWQQVEGAKKYKLRISDEEDEQIFETITEGAGFVYGKSGLYHGKDYQWTVLALAGGKAIARAEGWFSILKEAQIRQLEKTESEINVKFPGKNPERLINLALVFQEYALFDATTTILKQLSVHFPENRNIKNWTNQITCE